ncbi:MAG: D-alanyl-D-alanine carboxypeptidase [Desulfobulbaceae bacterium]|nr:MAG: D-alanyl-D-alanine carboxypeptidase [Desulfobulbaceae bacterium]
MGKKAPHIVRTCLLLGFVILLSLASVVEGVPILKDQKKTPVSTVKTKVSRSVVQTLGSYNDISAAKRRTTTSISNRSRLTAISARSVIIIDAISGKTIYAKAPDSKRQPASTIKVLTGILAIDLLKNNQRVGISKKAARQPRSKIYLDTKKTYLADDLINAVLLSSANDASVALAEKISGSEASFAKLMTERARLWGARNTTCRTASGLTARGQKTTARDLAIIFRKAMNDREFARRMKRTTTRTSYGKTLRNHNKALWQVDGTLAGKTGYTNAARQTYVGKFKRGNDEIIVALLGSETMWTDLKKLVSYGFRKKQQIRIAENRTHPNIAQALLQ